MSRLFGDYHNCEAWRIAEADLRAQGKLTSCETMLALAAYSDKTMKRSIGQISYWPMILSILNLPPQLRGRVASQIVVAYIPHFTRPSGANDKAFSDGMNRLANGCWQQVINAVQDLEDTSDPLSVQLLDGAMLKLRARIIQLIADHPEAQFLCGVSPSAVATRPCRFCLCHKDQLHEFFTQQQQNDRCCKARTIESLLRGLREANAHTVKARKVEALLAAGNLSGVATAFLLYKGFATEWGILQASAQDKLHHFHTGLCKMLLDFFLRALLDTKKNKQAAEALARWSRRISSIARYDDPATGRRSKHFGPDVLTAAGLTGDDTLAVCFQFKYALGEVPDVFAPAEHHAMLELLLQFETLYIFLAETEAFGQSDLDTLEMHLGTFISKLSTTFGPQSRFKYNISRPKVHACSHLRRWIELFGVWRNLDTSSFEKAHSVTKDHAAHTNNRSNQELTMLNRINFEASLHSTLKVNAARGSKPSNAAGCTTSLTAEQRSLVPAVRSEKLKKPRFVSSISADGTPVSKCY
jgi:hypothetical protein